MQFDRTDFDFVVGTRSGDFASRSTQCTFDADRVVPQRVRIDVETRGGKRVGANRKHDESDGREESEKETFLYTVIRS